jgi:hypothetical protein
MAGAARSQCGYYLLEFHIVVRSFRQNRLLMHLASHRTQAKMALSMTEPHFPIVLKPRMYVQLAEPLTPNVFILHYSKTHI